jgi:hypothetical protein
MTGLMATKAHLLTTKQLSLSSQTTLTSRSKKRYNWLYCLMRLRAHFLYPQKQEHSKTSCRTNKVQTIFIRTTLEQLPHIICAIT